MDAEQYKNDPRYTEAESHWHVMQKSGDLEQRTRDGEDWKLVDVFLSGGAPWGFTLRGGLEHREPLLITKVEEGSKAAAVSLQVGDELVNINEIPLSGYRQEAICLVKGSHKTLSLVVKRNMKMVDIVGQKMPSENDVHVARSFLTKILRSSMRRNEPISRPHSWHSTKFNESQSETAKTQSPPTPAWHTRYDASSSSTDLSSGWEQTNLRRVSDQFSSLGSMDSLEHVSHPYPAGQLSPAKSNNSMEHLGGGKRDSAYSSFSTSSGTPDYTLSKSNAASTENMLYKVNQWDAGGKHNNGRNSQSLIEGVKQDDRLTYFQMPGGCEGPQTDDQAGSRHSTSSRTSCGPVWHVPEKKKTASPSPPPPLPPARSDSFAATKVHERGLIIAHPEGPNSHIPSKVSNENCRSHNLSPKNDSFYTSSDKSNHNQFNSNKQYSLSSCDVRQGQPYHQRHHSDKSTFYPQPWATSVPKPQNIGGYACSMQELPTNGSAQHFSQNQRRNLSTSLATAATDQSTDSSSGQSRYYCVTTCQPTQPSPQTSGKPEDRKSATGVDLAQTGNEWNSQTVTKAKYNLPQHQQQQHSSHSRDSNGYSKHQVTTVIETSVSKAGPDDRGNQRGHNSQTAETQYMSYPPSRQSEQRRSLPLQHREAPQDIRHHSQGSSKICPQATPMLHSLSMDAAGQDEKSRGSNESLESKQLRRSERFATTLRSEIQMRRANLQKSKSDATLPGTEGETEEDRDAWKSTESTIPTSADSPFTNTYKDNLKEAQARVLKATSFRRKDLEPVLLEHPVAEALPNYPSSALARKDITPLPTVSESVMSKSGPAGSQVTRIGGRKRFQAEKKVRSFSEPDKIHEVGVKEDFPHKENTSPSLEQQKLFKDGKPTFPNHMPPHSYTENTAEAKGRGLASNSETEHMLKGIRSREYSEELQGVPYSAQKQYVLDQERLGTFAEYEARWNIQKKPPETKASGRYRSADNILDPGPEERTKTVCFHERSQSSPSADIYGQKIPVPAVTSETEYSQAESKLAEPLNTATGFSDRGPADCKVREKPVEFERYSAPPPPPMTGTNSDCRHRAAPATVNHRPTSISHSVPESALPQPENHNHTEPPSGSRRKPPVLEKPPPPRCPDSLESFTSSQSEIFTHRSPNSDPNTAFVPSHSPKGDSEHGKGLVDKGQGAVHQLSTSNPQPASSPPASSYRPSGPVTMEGQRSPSPQFSPQRLSDKPPVSLQDEDSNRMEHVIENQNTAVKKVPVRIVHSEGVTEKENCPFLRHTDSPVAEAESPDVTTLGSLGSSAFTRQRDPDGTTAAQTDLKPPRDPYMTTVREHNTSNSQQPPQPTEEPGGNRGGVTTGLSEDQKREVLARDIMGKDKSLADILDQSKMKTTMDLMEGIFPQGGQLLEESHHRRKVPVKQTATRSAEEREKEDSMAAAVTMVTSSTYYSTSAPKAELLIKMKDMQEQEQEEEKDSEDELDIDLANKKQELIDSLTKKLQVLREARESLQEDVLDNNALGDEVEAQVQKVCKPNELDKFRMFVGDLDKIVSLLLSLSGRLARVENALNSLEEDATPEERRTLIEKRKLLIRQHEDAKELKENLDRRERVVFDILASYLQEDSLTDYEHFVKMKSALIIEQRKLEDKIKLGEEQLKCLMDSLPIEQRLSF